MISFLSMEMHDEINEMISKVDLNDGSTFRHIAGLFSRTSRRYREKCGLQDQ